MTNTYKPTPERCAEWLKDHEYTQLAKTDTVEVWRAQKPGSSSYAFDLTMSRYGMAMYGDTGCLVWDVGASYGLEFLAGTDEDYVYRKLDASSRETDLDEAYLVEIVYEAIIELLGERDLVLPEWKQAPVSMAERIQELEDWLMQADCKDSEFSALVVALRACQSLENTSVSSAYEWLSEHQELLELADDLDYTLSKPTNAVLQRIYLVRHAAQMILAGQKASASEVVKVGSGGYPMVIRGALTFLHLPAEPECQTEETAQQIEYCYAMGPADEQWSDDGLAAFVSDRELAMGAVIQRAVVSRRSASSFLPDASDVIEHMANSAADDNSEWADGFPNTTDDQEAELARLLEPLKAWADRTCDVNFYTVANKSIEAYTVTAEDVAAGEAYRKNLETEVAA